ncbi:MAG: hypothetical protein HQL91_11300 [Magnetococcales bacterium]|nr:hypothetical protein [Magnetococcales bacterium]
MSISRFFNNLSTKILEFYGSVARNFILLEAIISILLVGVIVFSTLIFIVLVCCDSWSDNIAKTYLLPYIMCVSVFFLGVGGKNRATDDKQARIYQDFDRQYQELLKIVITHPDAATPSTDLQKYNAFAFMMWNFLETIYDYTKGSGKKEIEYRDLWNTWGVIVLTEMKNHLNWFEKNNKGRFKEEFIAWTKNTLENHIELNKRT